MSEWLRSFPLGSFPSPASLCDPIRRMIHTVRSLGFHRKRSRGTMHLPHRAKHLTLARGRTLSCVCSNIRVLPLVMFECVNKRVSQSKGLLSIQLFSLNYNMYSWFSWLHIPLHCFKHFQWMWLTVWIASQGCINKPPGVSDCICLWECIISVQTGRTEQIRDLPVTKTNKRAKCAASTHRSTGHRVLGKT